MTIGLVWAQAPNGVIGAEGLLPWYIPEDLAHFRALTRGHPVVMGRATWESLPERFRPLPERMNIVLSRMPGLVLPGATVVASLGAALVLAHGAAAAAGDDEVWVIGGGTVFAAALPLADRVELTVVDLAVTGDAHAPELDPGRWELVGAQPAEGWLESAAGVRFRFESYARTPGR